MNHEPSSGAAMTVYVLSVGRYEQSGVFGVFGTLEAAQAATKDSGWRDCGDGRWEADDSDDGADIEAFEVKP
jgi:hypothetical protein